jgi:DNA-nicking Smr family endonuclease
MVAIIVTQQNFHDGTMDSKDGKHSNSEDAALFRAAVADTLPLSGKRRHEPEPPRIVPRARQRRRDERAVLAESIRDDPHQREVETGDELVFRRPDVRLSTFRKLRRGRYSVRAEIDLHGLTRDKAHRELRGFIVAATREGIRCVRVVHGKGLGSGPGGPVLKHAVNGWLRNWDEVRAFVSAPLNDGGTGAVYVLLVGA